ncbi:MAG: Capsular polysaccharide export system protein KpsC [Acidobacteriaceae bacterium]|nr:Capsular polysaccharide export system protein KpsC [Acidobacteriaceae bacterium]
MQAMRTGVIKLKTNYLELFDCRAIKMYRGLLALFLFLSSLTGMYGQSSQESGQYPSSQDRQSTRYPQNTEDRPAQPGRERITNSDSANPTARRSDSDDRESFRIRNEEAREQPEPQTEFQQFVFASTEQKLRMFGQDLFRGVPSTFAPVDRVPVTSEYVIGPGDEIMLRGWGQIDIDYHAVVDRVGNLFIPKVGNVNVSGVKYRELQPLLKSAIGRVFRDFDLNVTLGQLRSIQVFVVGQAKRPGSYTVSSLSTLVNAVFASGGPSAKGSMRRIQLKRGAQVITEFDLYDLFINGDKSKDAQLLPGDVIYIPPVGPTIAMNGSVNVPAIYEIKPKTNLGDLIQLAGGLTSTASGQKATVERIKDRSVRAIEEFTLDDSGFGRILQDGDLVTLRALSARFDNAITIRGNVAAPGRYPWKEGIRISDLITSREALVTRNFWLAQSDLGKDDFEIKRTARLPSSNIRGGRGIDGYFTGTDGYSAGTDGHLDDKAVRGNQDEIQDDIQGERSQRAGFGKQSATVEKANRLNQAKFSNEIRRTAPDINWDYAVVQRLNRESLATNLVPFNLGKAISGGENADNLLLQPGDVITIFSQLDIKVPEENRSKFVTLEGEFASAGVYEVKPGETLPQLVARVGGLTTNAYLFGAEFTRESARETQQKNLDELVDRFERDVERRTSNKSQNVVSTEEALALKDRVDTQRKLVEKLKQVKATGRVVLGLKPSQTGVDALPTLLLEDGDRFVVPYVPSTVNVVGAVYNDNSYLYQSRNNIDFYVHKAGGGTREADRSHSFVVRADGSIVSKSRSAGWFSSGFESLKLMPGDTIVIPEQLDKTSVLKGLKDWSQVIGQFALGVAAINTLTK